MEEPYQAPTRAARIRRTGTNFTYDKKMAGLTPQKYRERPKQMTVARLLRELPAWHVLLLRGLVIQFLVMSR